MKDAKQKTLTKTVRFSGVSLHLGQQVELAVHPAQPNFGIRFKRSDLKGSTHIPGHFRYVTQTQLCTTISKGEQSISTIEHLMAALYGMGIDNAEIEVSGPELPIMDGSSDPFVQAFAKAGLRTQAISRTYLTPKKTIEFRQGSQLIRWSPTENLSCKLSCLIEFSSSFAIGSQMVHAELDDSLRDFERISKARTFCHVKDVELMQSQGFARGGSLENAVVVDDEQVLNKEGLRFDREFAYHKLLDGIGDLSLLGRRLAGQIDIIKGGHTFHLAFMRWLAERPHLVNEIEPVNETKRRALCSGVRNQQNDTL